MINSKHELQYDSHQLQNVEQHTLQSNEALNPFVHSDSRKKMQNVNSGSGTSSAHLPHMPVIDQESKRSNAGDSNAL